MKAVFDANQTAQEKGGMGELPNWIAPISRGRARSVAGAIDSASPSVQSGSFSFREGGRSSDPSLDPNTTV
jgi:hypothetical protein